MYKFSEHGGFPDTSSESSAGFNFACNQIGSLSIELNRKKISRKVEEFFIAFGIPLANGKYTADDLIDSLCDKDLIKEG